jgi:hypothetical protein
MKDIYPCPKCKKEFDYNYLLLRHLNKKKPCNTKNNLLTTVTNKIETIENQINENERLSLNNLSFTCNFCNNNYNNKSNLRRHIKSYCDVKKELINSREKLINEKQLLLINIDENNNMKLEMEKLKKENKKLKQLCNNNKQKTNINNGTINNETVNINNNNINIQINPFGKEDLSHISLHDYKKILSGFFPGFYKFIEKVHFDDNMPENHNVYVTNLNSKYAYVYENGQWNAKQKNQIIDKIISNKYTLLDIKCDELEDNGLLNKKILDDFDDFRKTFNEDNNEIQKNKHENVMLLLYNNKDKIINNKKQLEIN